MWLLPFLIVAATVALSVPMGRYLTWLMDGKYRPIPPFAWIERRLDSGPQDWKQYALALVAFNTLMFVFFYVVLALQPVLPLNPRDSVFPDGKGVLAPSTIFNAAAAFVTNTNLQHYAGEQHLSYFSQLFCVGWNMFVSSAVGFCCLAAVVRGLRGDPHMGNFHLDVWRSVAYVLVPFATATGLLLIAAGVPMTFASSAEISTVQDGAMGVDGGGDPTPQVIARGPVAAILPIKHLGTNGGGFFGANSAHPFENPNAWTNVLESVSILIFPFSLVVMFGRMLQQKRHAAVVYAVMIALFVPLIVWAVYHDSMKPNEAFTARPGTTVAVPGAPEKTIAALAALPIDSEGLGNTEGKELRFGPSAGPTFAVVATAVTCGSVNCMLDSLNPLAGVAPLLGMQLNCVFGGNGVGLVNMLVYLVIGVFLAGLMVGRTPEYLGKKIEAREMKLAMLALLIHPIMILGPTGMFAAKEWGRRSTNNPGAHGFSEILFEFSSASANNGSGFEGLGDTYGFNDARRNLSGPAEYAVPWDLATGLVMLISRFVPIITPLALASSLARKRPTPFTTGTMRTDTATFGFVLLGTVLLVGALLFLPSLALGPVADHLGPIPFGR